MNLSINKNDKSKPTRKTFKQLYQESKDKPLTKKLKRGFVVFGIVIVSIVGVSYASAAIDQSSLERDNVQIVISDIDDNISVDYSTNSRKIKAKLSGISQLAKAKIADNSVDINEYKDHVGTVEYEIKNIAEGENTIDLSIQDGKRSFDKTIKIKRQTKADYDQQELEKALERAEVSTSKAESDPIDNNISNAKSDIENLPEDKRQPFFERITTLEKIRQEEREERKHEEEIRKAQEAADEERRQQQVNQSQRQNSPQASPHPSTPTQCPRNCKEAKARGMGGMGINHPCYKPSLDRDNDGVACDK